MKMQLIGTDFGFRISAAILLTIASGLAALAGDPSDSDPANLPPPPAHAVGFPSRDPGLDVLPGFQKPPPGYGEVPFFWWLGDPLTKERLTWELDQFAGLPISAMQVNYAHSDSGGRSYGLTFPSEPPLFSADWWELFGWFMAEGKKRGMAVSLSDYTLAPPGQGWWTDEIIRDHPSICGSVLRSTVKEFAGGQEITWLLPTNTLSVVAWRLQDGAIAPGSGVNLPRPAADGTVRWPAPAGRWRLIAVWRQGVPLSLDPMNPLSGRKYAEAFFQRFEDRNPGEGGKGLNFFFSDELNLGVRGQMWTDGFAAEFQRRKGYDLLPELAALFTDIGPRTPKVRLDYSDVLVSLEEENYFRPIFDWHYSRGMIFGCDHGGRGQDVTEFGDYFRTQRWTTGPGNDQPRLGGNVIKNKVASSIAHLYQRPRVWLEGFYSSGWGTTTEDVTDATFRNFIHGHNLLTLHGFYYSLHGGFWEWAPPCNHFRMPYWPHLGEFLRCSERLSYLLSQGFHRCDVAVMYPVAPMEAGMDGKASVDAAFATGNHLVKQALDFDFMDFESLARAEIRDKKLLVSGEEYRALVLPAMKALRHSTLEQALKFHRAGGLVIALGALPEASDRAGRADAELDAMVKELFGLTAQERAGREAAQIPPQRSAAGGRGVVADKVEQVQAAIAEAFPRDFALLTAADPKRPAEVLHRKIGARDVFMVLGAPRGAECFFRARGRVERWDPWTGQTEPLHVVRPEGAGTVVRMTRESAEAQIVVFTPGAAPLTVATTDLEEITAVEEVGGKVTVRGFAQTGGVKQATVPRAGTALALTANAPAPPTAVALDGPWEFELKPTLDNRWGDFRLPATPTLIGPEARRFFYAQETTPNPNWQAADFDHSRWRETTCSFGPKFWKLGPLPKDADTTALEAKLAALTLLEPAVAVEVGGKTYRWQPYEFSWRWGIEGDPGHQGYHGLKGNVTDQFIALGQPKGGRNQTVYAPEAAGSRYFLWSSVLATGAGTARVIAEGLQPAAVWFNGTPLPDGATTATLQAGANPLLIRFDTAGRGAFVLENAAAPTNSPALPLAMSWFQKSAVLPLDARTGAPPPAGWYRFISPPGLRSIKLVAFGKVRAWANGRDLTLAAGAKRPDGSVEYTAAVVQVEASPVAVALRIEPEAGNYAGAALPEPIALDCGAGQLALGDWSKMGVLQTYSGGAWYRKTVRLTPEQTASRVTLDLGGVSASAEVRVNGERAGICVAPPWTVDISRQVKPGDNRIEVLVYNALANQYVTVPTQYRGKTVSGLLGPVQVEFAVPVVLKPKKSS
jgi:hypothetical protein